MAETNSKLSPSQVVTSGRKGKVLQSCSRIQKSGGLSSVRQRLFPLYRRTDPIAPSSDSQTAYEVVFQNSIRTTRDGASEQKAQSLNLSAFSSCFSPSSGSPSDFIGSRIPPFTAQNGYSRNSQLRREKSHTDSGMYEVSSVPQGQTTSTAKESLELNNNEYDATPLPLVRRNSLNDANFTRETTETVAPKTSSNLCSSLTPVPKCCSRPSTTSSALQSTAASLRHLHGVADSRTTSPIAITPSTRDSLEHSSRTLKITNDIKGSIKEAAVGYRHLKLVLIFMFVLIHVSTLIFFSNEFLSKRCWMTDSSSDNNDFSQPIVCSSNSLFRLFPRFLRSFIRVQIIDTSIPSPFSKFARNATNTVFQLRHPVLGLVELFKLLPIPQRFASYLRLLADQIDYKQQIATSTTAEYKPTLNDDDVLKKIKLRIRQFESSGVIENALRGSPESRSLRQHSDEFKQRIEHVTENVFLAIGYGLANVVIIETDEGLILFDTLENPDNMRRLMEDWSKQKDSRSSDGDVFFPSNQTTIASSVIAIVYSHFHPDHVFGASAVYTSGLTQIWGHETTDAEIRKVFAVTAGITYRRSMRQFGSLLSEEHGYINAGIGLHLDYDASELATAIRPTHIWNGDRKIIEIGGEELVLIHAPGESKDQSIVWMPKKRLLFGADNIYKSFPNIYAIRGTESRDAMIWVKSLDVMRELNPELLVLGHTGVLRGEELVYSTLTAYRDAIQFVHDQTVRYMNKGYSVDDIVQIIQLPPHLYNHPYLQQYYGTVSSAVRAVFHHYVGWFSGLSEELRPLARSDKAVKMAQLVGGELHLLERTIEAIENKEYQWALELVSYVLLLSPTCEVARIIKADVLRILAALQSSTPERNWYLTAARESAEGTGGSCESTQRKDFYETVLQGGRSFVNRYFSKSGGNSHVGDSHAIATDAPYSSKIRQTRICEQLKITKTQKDQCIRNLKSAAETLDFIPIRIKAEEALNMDSVVAFTFTDSQKFKCVHFRRGIVYVAPKCERKSDFHVYTEDETWKSIVTRELLPLFAIATRKFRIQSNNPLDFLRLQNLLNLIEIDM